jgi:hypothetical protein
LDLHDNKIKAGWAGGAIWLVTISSKSTVPLLSESKERKMDSTYARDYTSSATYGQSIDTLSHLDEALLDFRHLHQNCFELLAGGAFLWKERGGKGRQEEVKILSHRALRLQTLHFGDQLPLEVGHLWRGVFCHLL